MARCSMKSSNVFMKVGLNFRFSFMKVGTFHKTQRYIPLSCAIGESPTGDRLASLNLRPRISSVYRRGGVDLWQGETLVHLALVTTKRVLLEYEYMVHEDHFSGWYFFGTTSGVT